MTKHDRKPAITSRTALRRRAGILAVGTGASLVVGTGVALAAGGGSAPQGGELFALNTANALSKAVHGQADGQKKAADTKAEAAAKADKGAETAKAKTAKAKADAAERAAERAADKAAADRKKRAVFKAAAPKPASWVKPVDHYTKGSTFGLGGSMWSNKHSGQDLVVPSGTPVKAAHGGTVVEAGWGGSYGNNIVIKHGGRTYTQYGHLSQLGVSAGQTVKTGQVIGKSGSTGNSTGPHLHFETRTAPVYGYAVEPLKFMHSHGVAL
ncbi:M23 family metallopeptidase [Streptomyces sp. NPDC051776]|uniref:M23 family metallopeptidase n=1 Tax=Streptomyces sp. NPDC051776 TaxID=3155414 RepID=UPI00341A0E3A